MKFKKKINFNKYIETINHKIQTSNEIELIDTSRDCITESRLESLITESKFLTIESLEALVKVSLSVYKLIFSAYFVI